MRNDVNLLPTPFTERLKPLNLNHSWERWEGFLGVGAFDNVVREYFAIRNAVSVFDITARRTRVLETGDLFDQRDQSVGRGVRHQPPRPVPQRRVGRSTEIVLVRNHEQAEGPAFGARSSSRKVHPSERVPSGSQITRGRPRSALCRAAMRACSSTAGWRLGPSGVLPV